MREFEMFEIKKAKCPVCGCKNKVHTELLDTNGHFVGYTLKCCACGYHSEFFLDYPNNGTRHPAYREGRQMCIQPSFCPWRNECKLYRGKRETQNHCGCCPRYNSCDCHDCIIFDDDCKPDSRNSDDYIKLIPLPDSHSL